MNKIKRTISLTLTIFLLISTLPLNTTAANVTKNNFSVKSVVNGRDDGVWLFPVAEKNYDGISDWAGCSNYSAKGSNPCIFDGANHSSFDDPFHKGQKWGEHYLGHNGLDISVTKKYVLASAKGTVRVASTGTNGGRGNYVVIEHTLNDSYSYYSVYQHLESISTKKGADVEAGNVIGISGKSGGNYDYHLHFAILLGKKDYKQTISVMENAGWFLDESDISYWNKSTKSGNKHGRILNNPSAETYKKLNMKEQYSSIPAHCGSVTYTFKPNEVTVGVNAENITDTVAAAYNCIYAIKSDGKLYAWNNGKSKKILDSVISVKAGYTCDYAIKQDGSLWSLDFKNYGENEFPTPKKIMSDVADFDAYMGGADSWGCTGIVKKDGSLWASQLNWSTGKQTELIKVAKSGFVSVISNGDFLLALKEDKSLWIWEGEQSGNTNNTKTTRFIKIMDNVKQAGKQDIYTALIVKEDNSLWVWSYAEYAFTNDYKKIPKAVKVLDEVSEIFDWSMLATDAKGTLWTWDLDFDEYEKISFLKSSKVLENVKDVYGSRYSGTALKNDGTLWQWSNLGTPKKKKTGIQHIEGGMFYSTYLKDDGRLWATGYGFPGTEYGEKLVSKKIFSDVMVPAK